MKYTQEFIQRRREHEEEKREEYLNLTETQKKLLIKYRIKFKDYGQDFLEFFIDEDGWVVDCKPYQKRIWVGKFTIPQSAEIGEKLAIWVDGESYINYPIIEIEKLNDALQKLGEQNGNNISNKRNWNRITSCETRKRTRSKKNNQ